MTAPVESGLGAGLGLDDVPDDFADGTYIGYLTAVKVVPKKNELGKKSIVFTCKCNDVNSRFNGEQKDAWFSANVGDTSFQKKLLRDTFVGLGVPESRIATVMPEDIVGTPISFKVVTRGTYKNVTEIQKRSEANLASVASFEQANGLASVSGNIADLI